VRSQAIHPSVCQPLLLWNILLLLGHPPSSAVRQVVSCSLTTLFWLPAPRRSGVRVAIVGPPNAGKSSLLNALAGCEAAIVSAVPGTTRDLVQTQLELGGVKVGSPTLHPRVVG
jgi:hypothetical protein